MLKKNEELILSTPNVSLHEPRRVTTGGYGGASVRVAQKGSVAVGGFGLNGFFSSEEHYARDLLGYCRVLSFHPHHNYYFGRSEADPTPWLEVANPSRRARSRSLSAIYR